MQGVGGDFYRTQVRALPCLVSQSVIPSVICSCDLTDVTLVTRVRDHATSPCLTLQNFAKQSQLVNFFLILKLKFLY